MPSNYILRGECTSNKDTIKNDLKELINQERRDRKEGEAELKTEISTGLKEVKGEISSMKTAVWGLAASVVIAIIVAIIEKAIGGL